MINENVIKEIYKKYKKPHKNQEDLNLDYFLPLLNKHHTIESDGFEITIKDLDEGNLFRRFLIRSINAILDFEHMIAFVFRDHILFFGRDDNQMRVHIKPEKNRSIWSRIFSSN